MNRENQQREGRELDRRESPGAQLRWTEAFAACVCLLLGSVALFLPSIADSAIHEPGIDNFVHSAWTTSDGLPHRNVNAIWQDDDGFLWVGTSAGLRRFDGHRFTLPASVPTDFALAHGDIRALAGHGGVLWVGTYGSGLFRIASGRMARYTTENGLTSNAVRTLLVDRAGALWAGTTNGITLIDPDGQLIQLGAEERLAGEAVFALHEASDGALWIATMRGVTRRDGSNRLRRFTTEDGLPHNEVWAVHEDRQQRLWVGTAGGIAQVDDGKILARADLADTTDEFVMSVLGTRNGDLWFATRKRIVRFPDGGLRHSGQLQFPHDAPASKLLEDSEGNLWFGAVRSGLHRLKPTAFRTWSLQDGLSGLDIWAVAGDESGALWVGSANGVDVLAEVSAGARRFRPVQIPLKNVLSLLPSAEGLWVGSNDSLSLIRDGRVRRSLYASDALPGPFVFTLEKLQEELWIGTYGGAVKLDADRRPVPLPPPFASLDVRTLQVDSSGALWMGTSGSGLFRLQRDEITTYGARDGLGSEIVYSLLQDTAGAIWVGTKEGGVSRIRDGRIESIALSAAPALLTVYDMVQDNRDHIWMAGPQGICRAPRAALDRAASSEPFEPSLRCHGQLDGITGNPRNGSPSIWKTPDQHLWFATDLGVIEFDPALERSPAAPRMYVDELWVDGVRRVFTDPDEPIRLAPGSHTVEVRYTGIRMSDPDGIAFRYRLEGVDEEWIEAGSRRSAFYNDLTPGHYRFSVVGIDGDGKPTEESNTITIVQEAFFHQTLSFLLICLAAAAATIVWVVRVRIRWIRREFSAVAAERERIARDIHDNQAQALAAASIHLEVLTDCISPINEETDWHLERIRTMLKSGLKEAQRAVNSYTPDASFSAALAADLRGTGQELTQRTSVEFCLDVRGEAKTLSSFVDRNLYHVGQEAISNVLRHANATRIEVSLDYKDDGIRLAVSDNGAGFDPAESGHSPQLGMRGMRARVADLGGTIQFVSAPGSGTTVLVDVPM